MTSMTPSLTPAVHCGTFHIQLFGSVSHALQLLFFYLFIIIYFFYFIFFLQVKLLSVWMKNRYAPRCGMFPGDVHIPGMLCCMLRRSRTSQLCVARIQTHIALTRTNCLQLAGGWWTTKLGLRVLRGVWLIHEETGNEAEKCLPSNKHSCSFVGRTQCLFIV